MPPTSSPEQLDSERDSDVVPPGTRSLRVQGGLAAAIVSLAAAAVLYIGDSSLPTNSLELPGQREDSIKAFSPQGWAFFTRSPREADMRGWTRDGAGWTTPGAGPNASPEALFGLHRGPRARAVELGLIFGKAVESGATWTECADDTATCLADAAPASEVDNPTPSPYLCGDIGISSAEPVPWAWAKEGMTDQMPAKVMVVEVSC